MTNILFIGQHFPPEMAASIAADTRGKAGFSNHNFETALLRGFAAQQGSVVRAITLPLQYSWPASSSRWKIDERAAQYAGLPLRTVGYINLPTFSILTPARAMTHAILEEMEAFPPGKVHIVVNTPLLPVARALEKVRKIKGNHSISTTLILPDIPSCVATMSGMSGLKALLFGRINAVTMRMARKYDRYVFLTAAMNDFFGVTPDRMMVMEGVADTERHIAPDAPESPEPRIVLYTGSLFEVFGVMRLVEAFLAGDFPDTELWICGSGDMAGRLREISARYPQVRFLGLVSTREALDLQRRATLLANPRPSDGDYTRYSFPSKTLEYLAASRPVVMNRLPGIPAEYDDILIYPDDESTEAWTEAMGRVLDMSAEQRDEIGRRGREFVETFKTARAQTRRLTDFITGGLQTTTDRSETE